MDVCMLEEDLPQMDGTCDACEPDEPESALWMCVRCRFAFCSSHADAHTQSTAHTLQPYSSADAEADTHSAEPQAAALPPDGRRDTVSVERLKCRDHGQEGALYCKHDQRIICVLCAVQGEHRGHQIITLREAYLWQKSKEGIDLLEQTHEISERIKAKWASPDMSTEELEAYVNQQFDELQRMVRLEEWRVLHLVDLKEAFLTAQAAEKISEISAHTQTLQEEMDSITHTLQQMEQVEEDGGAPAALLAPLLARREEDAGRRADPDVRLRVADHRRNPDAPSADEDRGDGHIGHTP
ncbi:tripartite motif-containing protein 44 [Danio aesculapii]|uniref:tripartite motif-containing protein 44 n=1 Tax=Danio aesculapii TaxID=1142201 RepID=UPI0024C0B5FE|nr:tripartite motif-containing protein 44 [Danio aesculapii]